MNATRNTANAGYSGQTSCSARANTRRAKGPVEAFQTTAWSLNTLNDGSLNLEVVCDFQAVAVKVYAGTV